MIIFPTSLFYFPLPFTAYLRDFREGGENWEGRDFCSDRGKRRGREKEGKDTKRREGRKKE